MYLVLTKKIDVDWIYQILYKSLPLPIGPSFISLVHDLPGYTATVNCPSFGYMDYLNNELIKQTIFSVGYTKIDACFL